MTLDTDPRDRQRFEQVALPHLDAAYNLARWLTRDDHDAQDVVQDACLRALRHVAGFRGEQARAWLLQIVRHAAFDWLRANRPAELLALDALDEADPVLAAPAADEPAAQAIRQADRRALNAALAALPVVFREVLVLREMEELSYKAIAGIVEVPVGTVMSRLSRARALMRAALTEAQHPPARPLLRAVPRPASGDAA